VCIGVFARTVLPYLLKLTKGEVKFDWVYLRSAAVSAVLGVLGGGLILPAIDPAMQPAAAIWLGISTGYAVQGVARSVEKAATK
jgi:acyl-coenzyme A thioesterase PaaI-like protein